MKLKYTFAMAALLSFGAFTSPTALAQAATSKPVGYVTETLQSGFNLVGLTVHQPVLASGVVDAVSGTTVTDNEVDFGTALTAGQTYIFEVLTGTAAGVIQEVTVFSGNDVTTKDDISSELAAGDKYQLRAASTLETALGTTSSVLQKGLVSSLADIVWLPNGSGGFDRYFLNTLNQWKSADTNLLAPNVPVVYADGFFIEKRTGSVPLDTYGEVKTVSSATVVATGFNAVSGVFPSGSTLQNSGLVNDLQKGLVSSLADIIWLPKVGGGYDRYFFNTLNQLKSADTNLNVNVDVPLPSAFFIERRGADTNVEITPPSFYSSL